MSDRYRQFLDVANNLDFEDSSLDILQSIITRRLVTFRYLHSVHEDGGFVSYQSAPLPRVPRHSLQLDQGVQ